MGSQAYASLAVLVAVTFLLLAVTACANVEQRAALIAPHAIAQIPAAATPEFHGAPIGGDALRSRLTAEG